VKRLRAEFAGLRLTDRGHVVVETVFMLAMVAGGYLILTVLFPWCAS